jgi:hypothetical protein
VQNFGLLRIFQIFLILSASLRLRIKGKISGKVCKFVLKKVTVREQNVKKYFFS